MDALDLRGLFLFAKRPRLFDAGPLFVPGSISRDDQRALLPLLQDLAAEPPLPIVTVRVEHALQESERAFLRAHVERRGPEVALLVFELDDPRIDIAAFAAEPEVEALSRVLILCPHPRGIVPLERFHTLLLAIKERLTDAVEHHQSVYGGGLDAWLGCLDTVRVLGNPMDALRLANNVLRAHWEELPVKDATATARAQLVAHQLAWRTPTERRALQALAVGGADGLAREFPDVDAREGVRAQLAMQHLLVAGELQDWATVMADGRVDTIPTPIPASRRIVDAPPRGAAVVDARELLRDAQRAARRHTANTADADDLAQDTIVRFIISRGERLPTVETARGVWERAFDRRRETRRWVPLERVDEDVFAVPDNAEQTLFHREVLARVVTTEEDWRLLVAVVHGSTSAETAAELGLTPARFTVQREELRTRLRRALADDDDALPSKRA